MESRDLLLEMRGIEMPKIIRGNELAIEICKAIDEEPSQVSRIILDIQVREMVKIYIEKYGSDKLLKIRWADSLDGADKVYLVDAP